MITLYIALAALLAGAAAVWRATRANYVARLAVVESAWRAAAADRDTALSTVATRERELEAARADVVHLRERLRQIAGRDPVAAADDLADAFSGLRRPR